MPQKIYFGNVEVCNTKTREKRTIERKVFKEHDKLTDPYLRGKVFRDIKPKDRANWEIIKLCFDTAKYSGMTVY